MIPLTLTLSPSHGGEGAQYALHALHSFTHSRFTRHSAQHIPLRQRHHLAPART